MLSAYSLTQVVIGAKWMADGLVANSDGSLSKAYTAYPLEAGAFEEGFEGPYSDSFFSKLGDLLTRLPNEFDGQILLQRRKAEADAFHTRLYLFERVGGERE